MPKPTPTQRLASLHLKRDVREFVAEHLADGRSLAFIASALRDATDGAVDVPRQVIHAWVQRDGLAPAAQDVTA